LCLGFSDQLIRLQTATAVTAAYRTAAAYDTVVFSLVGAATNAQIQNIN